MSRNRGDLLRTHLHSAWQVYALLLGPCFGMRIPRAGGVGFCPRRSPAEENPQWRQVASCLLASVVPQTLWGLVVVVGGQGGGFQAQAPSGGPSEPGEQ